MYNIILLYNSCQMITHKLLCCTHTSIQFNSIHPKKRKLFHHLTYDTKEQVVITRSFTFFKWVHMKIFTFGVIRNYFLRKIIIYFYLHGFIKKNNFFVFLIFHTRFLLILTQTNIFQKYWFSVLFFLCNNLWNCISKNFNVLFSTQFLMEKNEKM